MSESKPTLFVGWFCPFAQRTWISFEHLNFDYTLVNSKESIILDDSNRYMLKGQPLLDATPAGKNAVVPLVVWGEKNDPTGEKPRQGSIALSVLCCPPDHPFLQGKDKAEDWDAKLCSGDFYKAFKPENIDSWERWVKGLEQFAAEIKGPFFFGPTFSIIDATVFPFLYRIFSLDAYKVYIKQDIRTFSFAKKVQDYVDACLALPAVKVTLPPDADPVTGFSQRLLDCYAAVSGPGLKSLLPGEPIPKAE